MPLARVSDSDTPTLCSCLLYLIHYSRASPKFSRFVTVPLHSLSLSLALSHCEALTHFIIIPLQACSFLQEEQVPEK